MDREFKDGPEFPKMLDNNDELGHFRKRFYIKKGVIYMCGNSLGLASIDAEEALTNALNKWKSEGNKIWSVESSKYLLYSQNLAQMMAHLIGVSADEIVIVGCTTINLHQALCTFYKPTKDKYKILVDDLNFPTDRYAVDSQVRLRGYKPKDAVKVVKSRDGKNLEEDDIIEAMTEDVAVVVLSTVLYKSAQVLDMEKVSREARKRGILIGWDLCHAIGVIEMDLKAIDVDFAVWCTYKYLNGGPGSPAGLYINRKHFHRLPGLAGWYGNRKETQFLMRQEFDHQQNANGWQLGTPTIFSMATLEGSLKMFKETDMATVRKKSLHLTGYMMYLIDKKLVQYGFRIANLRKDSRRGGHVCLEHDEGYRISLALKSRGVVSDFREPNVMRITPVALYTSFLEVYNVVEILVDVMKTESFKQFALKRPLVV